jgi:16S rRNA (uracil1498-N3)-methyltransferase
MHRVYINSFDGETITITDAAQLHHLKDVLRLKAGEKLVLFDGEGNEYAGTATAIGKEKVLIRVIARKAVKRRQVDLTIACAIPKGDRMDDIIDQLTQLGVKRIIPMMTERVVVKLDSVKKAARLKRWVTIAQSAAEQSQRNSLPVIDPVTHISDVIAQSGENGLKLIPHLEGKRKSIKDVISGVVSGNVLALIGPEGDFTPGEIRQALKAGFIPVSLGDTVLRVATAAAAVAAYIKLASGA